MHFGQGNLHRARLPAAFGIARGNRKQRRKPRLVLPRVGLLVSQPLHRHDRAQHGTVGDITMLIKRDFKAERTAFRGETERIIGKAVLA